MSSHPGSTLKDTVYLAEYLYKNHMRPEQVQDFYPTPGTVSTCMFYTGLDPYTLKPVFVEKTAEGKALQRALLQYYEPRNAEKVIKALKMTHREDLIPLLVPAEGRIAVQRSARRAAPPPRRAAARQAVSPAPAHVLRPIRLLRINRKVINRKRIHRGKLQKRKSDRSNAHEPPRCAGAGRSPCAGPRGL